MSDIQTYQVRSVLWDENSSPFPAQRLQNLLNEMAEQSYDLDRLMPITLSDAQPDKLGYEHHEIEIIAIFKR